MKEKMKETALKVKNHVVRQRWAYAWATLAVLATATAVRNQQMYNEFLKEKGIDPTEFFTPEAFEELNS